MKILTKEEEQQHYNATVRGGLVGGSLGAFAGAAGVWAASKRYPAFRSLTLPFRAFLIASSSTFAAIVSGDHYSRRFESARHPEVSRSDDSAALAAAAAEDAKPPSKRVLDWASENRYSIVFGSWLASMAIALGLVGRNPYLTGQQKLVQARVYAQGLTLAVVIASLSLESKDARRGEGRWQTVKVVDPNDPTHKHMIEKRVHKERYSGEDQWMDMIAAEEQRMKEREQPARREDAKGRRPSKQASHTLDSNTTRGDDNNKEH